VNVKRAGTVWAVLAPLLLLVIGLPSGVTATGNPQNVRIVTFNDPDGVAGDGFGYAVALSGDGSTALIGAFAASESGIDAVGKAYIFTSTYGTWSANPTATFIDPGLQPLDKFGNYVALSADGSTALIGGGDMIAYVYEKVNGNWSGTPAAVLNDPDPSDGGAYGDCFGCALALSADGNTALIGAFDAGINGIPGVGKVYVFTRNNGIWSSTPATTFSDPGTVKGDDFGNAVALSADGSVALIGTAHLFGPGRAFVFDQTNGSWNTVPSAIFDISDNGEFNYEGSSVALSAAGNIALIGVRGINNGTGIANLYAVSNNDWSKLPTEIWNDPRLSPGDSFGTAVALSSNGSTAVIQATYNVYVYVESGGQWPSMPSASLSNPNSSSDGFATMAVSSNGDTVLTGFPGNAVVCVIPPPSPPSPVPCSPPARPGQAFLFQTTNRWANPAPTPPPSNPGGSSGSGVFGWLSGMALFMLLMLTKTLTRPNR
jgi:hypothetical protein